ncbi:MAG: antitoxin VapB family protein [Candidatus Micrarchaeaceae archaeon]
MAKTITIRETVYKNLVKAKKSDESFSELFERLLKMASPVDILTRIKGSVEFKNKRKMLSELYAKRSEMRP